MARYWLMLPQLHIADTAFVLLITVIFRHATQPPPLIPYDTDSYADVSIIFGCCHYYAINITHTCCCINIVIIDIINIDVIITIIITHYCFHADAAIAIIADTRTPLFHWILLMPLRWLMPAIEGSASSSITTQPRHVIDQISDCRLPLRPFDWLNKFPLLPSILIISLSYCCHCCQILPCHRFSIIIRWCQYYAATLPYTILATGRRHCRHWLSHCLRATAITGHCSILATIRWGWSLVNIGHYWPLLLPADVIIGHCSYAMLIADYCHYCHYAIRLMPLFSLIPCFISWCFSPLLPFTPPHCH